MALKQKRHLFFSRFPRISYVPLDDTVEPKTVTNILASFELTTNDSNSRFIFQKYTLKDTDKPESFSNKFYGTPKYYWMAMFVNNVIDPYVDWMMDQEELEAFVTKKYENGIPQKLADGTIQPLKLSVGLEGINHFIDVVTLEKLDPYNDELNRDLYEANPASIGETIRPVTNLAFEGDINRLKRVITVINPLYINSIYNNYINTISEKGISDDAN